MSRANTSSFLGSDFCQARNKSGQKFALFIFTKMNEAVSETQCVPLSGGVGYRDAKGKDRFHLSLQPDDIPITRYGDEQSCLRNAMCG